MLWHKTVFAEVSCTVDYKILNQWNNGFTAEVKNYNWNKNIPKGSVIDFGFNASHQGTNDILVLMVFFVMVKSLLLHLLLPILAV